MAAITPFVEADSSDVAGETPSTGLAGLGAAAAVRTVSEKTLVEASLAGLTRLAWNRRLVEEHLRKCRYWLEESRDGTVIRIDPPLPHDARPWKRMSPSLAGDTFKVFSEGNSKMATLSWDLPAGPPAMGGTCPGATAAQVHAPLPARLHHLTADRRHLKGLPPGASEPLPYSEARAICAYCYASEGRYDYTEIQAGTVVRYWWSRESMRTAASREQWIKVMTLGVLRSPFPVQSCQYAREEARLIRPVRVHSSGDFFSAAYAAAWMEVGNRVAAQDPRFRFWAPTRTWAAPGGFDWPAILALNTARNFVVRPSAYHIGDAAPGELAPGRGHGSTSLVAPVGEGKDGKPAKPTAFQKVFGSAIWQGENDPRRAFDCKAYAVGADGSCAGAQCRVCWTRPDLSVNYTFH